MFILWSVSLHLLSFQRDTVVLCLDMFCYALDRDIQKTQLTECEVLFFVNPYPCRNGMNMAVLDPPFASPAVT